MVKVFNNQQLLDSNLNIEQALGNKPSEKEIILLL